FIPWEQIEYVKTAEELQVRWYELKGWGMAFSDIWWNCSARCVKYPPRDGWGFHDKEHILKTNFVVKVKDSSIRCGSHVDHPDEAMEAVSRFVQHQESQ
ncbi:hypothetical protein GGI21_004900, partial [Coemansia aciculifera]